jgi:hypothetical protein
VAGAAIDLLRAARLVEGDALHPDIVELATVIARPAVRLSMDRLAPAPEVNCAGWVAPGLAVIALPLPGGVDDILAIPASEIVTHLAALAGLAPRPVAPADSAPPDRPRLHWRAEARWYGHGGAESTRSVAALDGGEQGWWLLDPDANTRARPVSSTTLFRRLAALLPRDEELG